MDETVTIDETLYVSLPCFVPFTQAAWGPGDVPMASSWKQILEKGIEPVCGSIRRDHIYFYWPYSEKLTVVETPGKAMLVDMPFKEVHRRINLPKKITVNRESEY